MKKLKRIEVTGELRNVMDFAAERIGWSFICSLILLTLGAISIYSTNFTIWILRCNILITITLLVLVNYYYIIRFICLFKKNEGSILKPLLHDFFYKMMRRRDRKKSKRLKKPEVAQVENTEHRTRKLRLVSRRLDDIPEIGDLKEAVNHRPTKYIGKNLKGYAPKVSFHRRSFRRK